MKAPRIVRSSVPVGVLMLVCICVHMHVCAYTGNYMSGWGFYLHSVRYALFPRSFTLLWSDVFSEILDLFFS